MSGKEQEFVRVGGPRRDKKQQKQPKQQEKKQPKQEKFKHSSL